MKINTFLKKQDVVVKENQFCCVYQFAEFYILLHTYSLDQTKNVLRVTKSRQIITF